MTTRVETWQGHNIRFVLKNDEWWAILSDVCKALGIDPMAAFMKLDETTIDQVENLIPSVDKYLDIVNEVGIYELMFLSNLSDANRMRFWTGTVLKRLRNRIGLSEYEVMRMMDGDIQEEIDNLLDDIFYDEETGKTMISVTVAGGDVEQVPIEDIL
jgi:prophage antirepressor-like protein|nr:MAG TPA: antirepressor [Caudoviricetes sp.]